MIFVPLSSTTSTGRPMSFRYWRSSLSGRPIPAEVTVSSKSSSSRSRRSSMARLRATQSSMSTEPSLSITTSISLPGVMFTSTRNRLPSASSSSAMFLILSASILFRCFSGLVCKAFSDSCLRAVSRSGVWPYAASDYEIWGLSSPNPSLPLSRNGCKYSAIYFIFLISGA